VTTEQATAAAEPAPAGLSLKLWSVLKAIDEAGSGTERMTFGELYERVRQRYACSYTSAIERGLKVCERLGLVELRPCRPGRYDHHSITLLEAGRAALSQPVRQDAPRKASRGPRPQGSAPLPQRHRMVPSAPDRILSSADRGRPSSSLPRTPNRGTYGTSDDDDRRPPQADHPPDGERRMVAADPWLGEHALVLQRLAPRELEAMLRRIVREELGCVAPANAPAATSSPGNPTSAPRHDERRDSIEEKGPGESVVREAEGRAPRSLPTEDELEALHGSLQREGWPTFQQFKAAAQYVTAQARAKGRLEDEDAEFAYYVRTLHNRLREEGKRPLVLKTLARQRTEQELADQQARAASAAAADKARAEERRQARHADLARAAELDAFRKNELAIYGSALDPERESLRVQRRTARVTERCAGMAPGDSLRLGLVIDIDRRVLLELRAEDGHLIRAPGREPELVA